MTETLVDSHEVGIRKKGKHPLFPPSSCAKGRVLQSRKAATDARAWHGRASGRDLTRGTVCSLARPDPMPRGAPGGGVSGSGRKENVP